MSLRGEDEWTYLEPYGVCPVLCPFGSYYVSVNLIGTIVGIRFDLLSPDE